VILGENRTKGWGVFQPLKPTAVHSRATNIAREPPGTTVVFEFGTRSCHPGVPNNRGRRSFGYGAGPGSCRSDDRRPWTAGPFQASPSYHSGRLAYDTSSETLASTPNFQGRLQMPQFDRGGRLKAGVWRSGPLVEHAGSTLSKRTGFLSERGDPVRRGGPYRGAVVSDWAARVGVARNAHQVHGAIGGFTARPTSSGHFTIAGVWPGRNGVTEISGIGKKSSGPGPMDAAVDGRESGIYD